MSLVVRLSRARDMLDVQVECINLALDLSGPSGPRLRRESTAPAFIVLRLPPQHVAEAAFARDDERRVPYAAFLACPSRIAFQVPESVRELPFTIDGILDAVRNAEPVLRDPASASDPATALGLPDGLLLVPAPGSRLTHRLAPFESSATRRTEMWHTRLGGAGASTSIRFRARANSVDADRFTAPARSALTRRQRDEIVRHSTRDPGRPHVIAADACVLTPLGATTRLASDWPVTRDTTLVAWEHAIAMGRDRRVRTVAQGFLFPFCHRASVVTLTERRIGTLNGTQLAEQRQSTFLTIQEIEKRYDQLADAYPFAGREMPFTAIRLAVPASAALPISGGITRIPATLIDASDQRVDCVLDALFVETDRVADPAEIARLLTTYAAHNTVACGNAPVTFAGKRTDAEDSDLAVESLRFGVATAPDLAAAVRPPFLPFLESADVRVPAVDQLLGTVNPASAPARRMTLHERYLREDFAPTDTTRTFAKFTSPLPDITVPAERAGGLSAPRFRSLNGLARRTGPVAGVDVAALSPSDLIDRDTMLLGSIRLLDLVPSNIGTSPNQIAGIPPDALFDRVDDPRIVLNRPVMTMVRNGAGVEARFLWKPRVEGNALLQPLAGAGAEPMTLVLKGRIRKKDATAPGKPAFEVEGRLRNFVLKIAGVLDVAFDGVEFRSGDGRKMDVKVHVRGVTFGDKLKFVAAVEPLLSVKALGGGGPLVHPLPDGVRVGYVLPLPAVPLGIFNLQNVALALSVSLPFVAKRPAAVRFALAERSHPFLLSASIFGGTGYFAIEVRTDGSFRLEAALEFGGVVAFNIAVLSGSVYLFAGIFVVIDSEGEERIAGHLRCGGQVEVLGLISVSIELYIGLEHRFGRNVLAGEGRVTVGIKILFFSKSIGFTVRKEVAFGSAPSDSRRRPLGPGGAIAAAGSLAPAGGAPRHQPVMDIDRWRTYCAAFA